MKLSISFYLLLSITLTIAFTVFGGWYELSHVESKSRYKPWLNIVEHLANAIPVTIFLVALVDTIRSGIMLLSDWVESRRREKQQQQEQRDETIKQEGRQEGRAEMGREAQEWYENNRDQDPPWKKDTTENGS